jgi:hypothetical protein
MSYVDEDPHQQLSADLIDALMWEDAGVVLKYLRKLDRIDGEALEIIIKMVEDDSALKPRFRNRFKIVTWKRGRKKNDPGLHPIIRRDIQRWRDEGQNLKEAIHTAQIEHGQGRTALMKIWAARPKPKSG